MRIDEFTDRDAVPISPDRRKPRIEIAVSADLMAVSQCDNAAAISAVHSAEAGLDATEAAERLRRFGPNQIARERRTGVLYELANRTKNPLNALLLTLAVVSYFLGDVRGRHDHRGHGGAVDRDGVHPGASLQPGRGQAARAGEDHGEREAPGDLSHPSKVEGFVEFPMEEIVPGDVVGSRPAT